MVGYSMMAWSKGSKSAETAQVKRYVGIAPVSILAVNPGVEELREIFPNAAMRENPSYTGFRESLDGGSKTRIATARIDFLVRTDAARSGGMELVSRVTFFLSREMRKNRAGTKVQVIDKYGRTAWVTNEELASHVIPVYSNGPAKLYSGYRPCYSGEENLTVFLRTYLGIPNVDRYDSATGTWSVSAHPEECEARLERIEDYFKGDFSELRETVALQPANRIKVMFGVRSSDDGRMYQTVFTDAFMANNAVSLKGMEKALSGAREFGRYPDTVFDTGELKPYEVIPTDLDAGSPATDGESELPFAF